ncbi:F-box only protein, partial [Ooceraea biroi]
DLTNIYYAKELPSYLKHRHLKHVWQEFINRPADQQLLEEVATFSAQWFQPEKNVSYSHIERELDKIAQLIMEDLKRVNPIHPIFSASCEQFSFRKYHTVEENHWDKSDGIQILDSLRKIFFSELNFRAAAYDNPKFFREYLLINYVLEEKVGKAIMLAIMFQSVARRLDIRCDLLSFPVTIASSWSQTYLLLKWQSKWNLDPDESEECYYIDVLRGETVLDNNRIWELVEPIISSDRYCRIDTFEVIIRV